MDLTWSVLTDPENLEDVDSGGGEEEERMSRAALEFADLQR